MVTTAKMRDLYPELILSSSPLRCSWRDTVTVKFLAGGSDYPLGYVYLRFHPAAAPWARALAAVMFEHGYAFREKAGGTVACRLITGGSRTSLHAHGVALDINPSKNRYRSSIGFIQWGRQTDMSKAMISDLEAILTMNGKKITQWGGRWYNIKDPMHFQCSKCRRIDLKSGIDYSTVSGWSGYSAWAELEDDIVLKKGDEGDLVEWYQIMLNVWGANPKLVPDGDFGTKTETAVKQLQVKMDVPATGMLDGTLAGFLSSYSRRYEEDELSQEQADLLYAPISHGAHGGGLTIQEVADAYTEGTPGGFHQQ